jgi:hypothetical protein
MKLEFLHQIFKKCSNIKLHENPFNGYRVFPRRRTEMTKLTVAVGNFASAPKKINANNKGDLQLSQLQGAKRVNELAVFADILNKEHGNNRA